MGLHPKTSKTLPTIAWVSSVTPQMLLVTCLLPEIWARMSIIWSVNLLPALARQPAQTLA